MKLKKAVSVMICFIFMVAAVETVSAASYSSRTSVPSNTNRCYYSTSNPFFTSNLWTWCTWYAYGRAYEILGKKPDLSTRAAGRWFRDNKSKYDNGRGGYSYSTNYNEARLGAIACYSNHVQVVESVASDGTPAKFSTGGYGNNGTNFQMPSGKNWRRWTKFNYCGETSSGFQGYIYLLENTNSNTGIDSDKGSAKTYYVTGTVALAMNDRAAASPRYSTEIAAIPLGADVAVYPDRSSGGWFYVSYGGREGYAYSSYLTTVAPSTRKATVIGLSNNGMLAINNKPAASPRYSTEIGAIPNGASVTVYTDYTSGNWYYVNYNGIFGYAYKSYIR